MMVRDCTSQSTYCWQGGAGGLIRVRHVDGTGWKMGIEHRVIKSVMHDG